MRYHYRKKVFRIALHQYFQCFDLSITCEEVRFALLNADRVSLFLMFADDDILSRKIRRTARADPEGGDRGSGHPPPPPLEFWQKSGYQIRDWDRFDIAQHLCKLQS